MINTANMFIWSWICLVASVAGTLYETIEFGRPGKLNLALIGLYVLLLVAATVTP